MSPLATRVVLALLAVSGLIIGVWAAFAPRSFYVNFPGGGHSWVAPDGAYNEHLVRDVGELNLAITFVTLYALLTMARNLVLATAGAWLVYGVPHLVYHLRHLSPFSGGDVVSIPVSLALGVAGALLLLLPPRPAQPVTSSVGSAGTSRHNQPNPAAGDWARD